MPRTPPRPRVVRRSATVRRSRLRCRKTRRLAAEIKALVVAGQRDAARERFADLVALQQRRAVRIAYHYLRDAHDADEAVQDAFVKVFTHITTYREDLPFEVWFTRILVNGCLDLRKSRARRLRWSLPMSPAPDAVPHEPSAPDPSPEDRLVSTRAGAADCRGRRPAARAAADGVHALPDRRADARARSARRSASARRRFASTCSAPSASCGGLLER